MFSEEVKQVTYLAVTCMLLALVLTFASQLMQLKNDMVNMRNEEILSNEQVVYMREFSKYNSSKDFTGVNNKVTNPLTGLDIIEAITEYQNDADMCIYVDKTGQGGNAVLYSRTNRTIDPSRYTIEHLQNLYTGSEVYGCILLENLPYTSGTPTETGAISCLNSLFSSVRNNSYDADMYKFVRTSDSVPVRAMFFFRAN